MRNNIGAVSLGMRRSENTSLSLTHTQTQPASQPDRQTDRHTRTLTLTHTIRKRLAREEINVGRQGRGARLDIEHVGRLVAALVLAGPLNQLEQSREMSVPF